MGSARGNRAGMRAGSSNQCGNCQCLYWDRGNGILPKDGRNGGRALRHPNRASVGCLHWGDWDAASNGKTFCWCQSAGFNAQ